MGIPQPVHNLLTIELVPAEMGGWVEVAHNQDSHGRRVSAALCRKPARPEHATNMPGARGAVASPAIDAPTMEPTRQLRIVWRYRWWLLLFAIAAAGAAYAVSTQLDETYRGQALVRLSPSQQATGGFLSEVALQQITESYAELGRSPGVLERARTNGQLQGTTEAQLRSAITIDPQGGGVLQINGDHGEPRTAASYANAVAEAVTVEVQRAAERDRQDVLDRLSNRVLQIRKELDRPRVSPAEQAALEREFEALQLQTAEVRSRASDSARLISSARVPTEPESPKPALNAALTFLFALLLGAILLYLRSALSNRYESGVEAASDLGLPLLSEVPRQKSETSAVREAFRALRTNVEFALSSRAGRGRGRSTGRGSAVAVATVGSRAKSGFRKLQQPDASSRSAGPNEGPVLLITSPEPGTGKTFVTSNLARSLAADGLEVLAVDSDLRRPTLHRRYDISRSPGLSDLLAASDAPAKAPDLIQNVDSNLEGSVAGGSLGALSAGAPLEQSSEALSTERMAHLVEELAGQHDVVALDSPPVLAAVDATVLARYADGVILVVDARQTERRAARRAVQALQAVDARLVGIVFNSAPDAEVAYYGYEITTD